MRQGRGARSEVGLGSSDAGRSRKGHGWRRGCKWQRWQRWRGLRSEGLAERWGLGLGRRGGTQVIAPYGTEGCEPGEFIGGEAGGREPSCDRAATGRVLETVEPDVTLIFSGVWGGGGGCIGRYCRRQDCGSWKWIWQICKRQSGRGWRWEGLGCNKQGGGSGSRRGGGSGSRRTEPTR